MGLGGERRKNKGLKEIRADFRRNIEYAHHTGEMVFSSPEGVSNESTTAETKNRFGS